MSEDDAWTFICDLPEEVTPVDEWMAFYLVDKYPSIKDKLKNMETHQ